MIYLTTLQHFNTKILIDTRHGSSSDTSFRWQWQNQSTVLTQLLWEDGELGPMATNNLLAEFSPTHQQLHQRHTCEIRCFEVRAVLTTMPSFNPLVLWNRTWFQCGPLLSWSRQNCHQSSSVHVVTQIFLKHVLTHLLQPKFWFYYKFPLNSASSQRTLRQMTL